MNDYTRLLKSMWELYHRLETQMTSVATSEDEATCNNGYAVGLATARREIGTLLMEEQERTKRLLDALCREEG